MFSNVSKFFASVIVLAGLFFAPVPAQAAPGAGACCHLINGCCGAPSELQSEPEGGVGAGDCRIASLATCNGILDTYKGDGTTCEEFCPIPTTTTSTTLPMGACCEPGGSCLDVIEANCVIGNYQGDGTECATVECTQPTTTTVPETTTTTYDPPTTTTTSTTVDSTSTTQLPIVVICGDANADEEVSSVDALIALKTSVGTAQCPLVRCDYNGSGEVASSDALAILRVGVGQIVVPMDPSPFFKLSARSFRSWRCSP